MTRDPIEHARTELARIDAPTPTDLDAQRARLDAAMHEPRGEVRRRRTRRWLPTGGIAVAGLAAAMLVVIALQPGSIGESERGTPERTRTGLELVTGAPGGAFAGLDLETASAAEVLEAAGRSAASGADGVAGQRWTYVRLESTHPNVTVGRDGPKVTFRSIDEMWQDTKTGRKFAINETTLPGREPRVGLHYEHLAEQTIGSVGWIASDGVSVGPRKATWHTDAGDGDFAVEMHLALRRQLPDATSGEDVQAILDEQLDASGLTFRDGAACRPRGGCMGWGGSMGMGLRLNEAESRMVYGRGLLLNTTAYEVFEPAPTRAIYDYLASLPGTTATPVDGSSNVELVFTNPGARPGTGERIVLDGDTGRIVERGRATHGGSTRWAAVGAADEPMVGGILCDEHPEACAELRELHERLQEDPKAQFDGVIDWMFIQQFCDGMINRDGSPNQDTELPRSMSKDPKVAAEREACERREAAAARGR